MIDVFRGLIKHLMEKVVVHMGFLQVDEETRSVFSITRLLLGRGWDARLFFVTEVAREFGGRCAYRIQSKLMLVCCVMGEAIFPKINNCQRQGVCTI